MLKQVYYSINQCHKKLLLLKIKLHKQILENTKNDKTLTKMKTEIIIINNKIILV